MMRRLETELVAHCGSAPTVTQRILIDRAVKLRVRLDSFDEKLASGKNWRDIDSRTYGGLLNAYRLTVRELGMKAPLANPWTQSNSAGCSSSRAPRRVAGPHDHLCRCLRS